MCVMYVQVSCLLLGGKTRFAQGVVYHKVGSRSHTARLIIILTSTIKVLPDLPVGRGVLLQGC